MKVTFNSAKRSETLKDRGLDFTDADIVLSGRVLTFEDARFNYPEVRYQSVGFLAGRMVMVVWTPRGDAVHVISMRKCNAREKAKYQKRFEEG